MNTKDGALDQRFVVPVRTTLQISGWEGPEGIHVSPRMAASEGGRTILFANPPQWTKEANCLDDWKAFDETNVDRDVAAALCAGCPVIDHCLSDAMAEEGTQTPHHRAGIRGGLVPVDRFALAVGDKDCEAGHPMKKFAMVTADGRTYCGECAREARTPKRTGTRKRDRSLWECDNCGRTIPKRNKNMHKRTIACQDFVR